jgi:glyoxalase family protein
MADRQANRFAGAYIRPEISPGMQFVRTQNPRLQTVLEGTVMMKPPILGIHHVTAIASDPQRTLDFYTKVLGLRLVKRTVNFDDPNSYHLYFGDETGSPGTILNFFPCLFTHRGSTGAGMVEATAFSVPDDSLGYWEDRLRKSGVSVERQRKRFEESVLAFTDTDGMKLEIAGQPNAQSPHPWPNAAVPPEHAIRGFHSITFMERRYEKTARLLLMMGFQKISQSGNRFRFDTTEGSIMAHVDVLCASDAPHGSMGAGSVHHVAFRVSDGAAQMEWRKRLIENNLDVTPVLDRQYFYSIYFREPGGVLLELATDLPGFAIDEPVESLGEALKLPPWLEPKRSRIEGVLPAIQLSDPVEDSQS